MTRGLVILSDGELQPFNGAYQDIHNAVGGYIEAIPIEHPDITVYVCEDGKALRYRRNMLGELVWDHYGAMGCLEDGDWLAGNLVVLGGVDAEGEDTDLKPEHVARIEMIGLAFHKAIVAIVAEVGRKERPDAQEEG